MPNAAEHAQLPRRPTCRCHTHSHVLALTPCGKKQVGLESVETVAAHHLRPDGFEASAIYGAREALAPLSSFLPPVFRPAALRNVRTAHAYARMRDVIERNGTAPEAHYCGVNDRVAQWAVEEVSWATSTS